MQTIPAADFRLLRLILLDSYAAGGEAIIDLADGVILTGENASGKTSLLSLLPLFYGENPRRCTTGSSSFSEFYLPHSTSYVIFEYLRRDVKCMAVMYGVGEGSFRYRIIRSPYDVGLFTQEGDGETLLTPHELKARLDILRVQNSHDLGRSEYRNIIQGRVFGKGKELQANRALIANYSFTDSSSQLLHIEKIVSGMFSRKANFEEFLTVIVDYISKGDADSPIAISGDRSHFAEWPAQFAAYNDVMQYAGMMEEVQDIDNKLTANRIELCDLHAKMILLSKHYESQQATLAQERENHTKLVEHERVKFNEALIKHQGDESKFAAEAKEAESRVKTIEDQTKEYEKQNIAKMAELVDGLQQTKAEIGVLDERKQALLGETSNIEQQYREIELSIGNAHLSKMNQFSGAQGEIRDQFEPKFETNRTSLQSALTALQSAASTDIDAIRTERDQLIGDQSTWQNAVANPVPDPVAVTALENNRASMGKLREMMRKSQDERRGLEQKKVQAIKSYDAQAAELKRLRERSDANKLQHQNLLAHLNPGEDSLLHFLRENKPDWTGDIAKLIREDVLLNNKLSPSITDGENGLYGVRLDLSNLDGPLCADEKELQRKINGLREEQRALDDCVQAGEVLLAECNQRRASADEVLTLHDAEYARYVTNETALQSDETAAKQAVEASKRKAKNDAERQLSVVRTSIQSCDRRLAEVNGRLSTDRAECTQKHGSIEKSLRQQQAEALEAIRREMVHAEEDKEKQLAKLSAEKTSALAAKGIDTGAVDKIDAEMKAKLNDVQTAETWSQRVMEWRLWRTSELPKRGEQAERAKECRTKETEAARKKGELLLRWEDRQQELRTKNNQMDLLDDELRKNAGYLESKLSVLEDYPPSRERQAQPFDASWVLGNLFSQYNALDTQRKTLNKDLVSKINTIKGSFNRVTGSPTEQYFSRVRAEHDPEGNNQAAWVKPLKEWFSTVHTERRQHLMLQAKEYGSLVAAFHDDLNSFQRSIGKFNNDIQDSLNRVSVFRRITNINIKFESILDTLKYWEPVQSFTKIFRAWQDSGRDLPPPEFSDALKALVVHWEVKEGIRADRTKLINVHGDVIENGHLKAFRTTSDLEKLSSNGLSYLILCTIFVAFISKIRGSASVQITCSVDELLDLDEKNISDLLRMLRENGIRLLSACPAANVEIMSQFDTVYRIDRSAQGPVIVQYLNRAGAASHV